MSKLKIAKLEREISDLDVVRNQLVEKLNEIKGVKANPPMPESIFSRKIMSITPMWLIGAFTAYGKEKIFNR